MRISGFTMAKNVAKLYYPIKESIESLLPLVDEYIVALGDCDEDDFTREEIEKIGSDKIKIIDTVWDLEKYPNGMENAHQTDIAKSHCTGDWLFYLQADEVIHEKYLPVVKKRLEQLNDDKEVDGLLFRYVHFFGDYWHYLNQHGIYPKEIRVIRNDPEIHSFQSAQSFRRIPDFDGVSYRKKEGTHKLNVVAVDAYIYHYGWTRPPNQMQAKRRSLHTIHKGEKRVNEMFAQAPEVFDYGPIGRLPKFKGTHPKSMEKRIAGFNWKDSLDYGKKFNANRDKHKHETFKARMLTVIEQNLLGGRQLFGYSNWHLLKK